MPDGESQQREFDRLELAVNVVAGAIGGGGAVAIVLALDAPLDILAAAGYVLTLRFTVGRWIARWLAERRN